MLGNLTHEALIIFPTEINEDFSYTHFFDTAMNTLIDVLEDDGVSAYALTGDTLAYMHNYPKLHFKSALTEADEFFVLHNCADMERYPRNSPKVKEIELAFDKYPNKAGLSKDQRFSLMQQREAYAAKKHIDNCKLAFVFGKTRNSSYKVKVKANSGVMRIFVDINSFTITPFIGDVELSPLDVFDFPECVKPIYQWRSKT